MCLNLLWVGAEGLTFFFPFPLISLFENTQSHRKMKGRETTFLGENEENNDGFLGEMKGRNAINGNFFFSKMTSRADNSVNRSLFI